MSQNQFREKSSNIDIHLPLHLNELHLSVEIFVLGQSFPFHFDAGLEHVRVRVLFPPPHVTLHGCHDDHWLQLPFTDYQQKQSITWKLQEYITANFYKVIGLCSETPFWAKNYSCAKRLFSSRRKALEFLLNIPIRWTKEAKCFI